MRNKQIIILLWILMIYIDSSAQKEANIWYFGEYAGIDFNSGTAVAINNSAMIQYEGCASIADQNGDLLFYTNGMTVWNKNHDQMENGTGLMGGVSSTQSAIIVPKPLDSLTYYIFTVPDEISDVGLRYSVVDLSLSDGLGAITFQKNIYLIGPTMEKVTGVRHSNGKDVWVITHLWNSNTFYSYLIDESGVNSANPVISSIGSVQGPPCVDVHGSMKVSPDGKWLAIVNRCILSFELFNFENSTGLVSNPIVFPSMYKLVYGIEFSPDISKLYIDKYSNGSRIFQFDLNAGDSQAIINSATHIGQVSNTHMGMMQLAPDGKIYVSKHDNLQGDDFLGVINNPNEPGVRCNFVEDGFYLNGNKCFWGLPGFIQNYFTTDFTFINPTCFSDTSFFTISNANSIVTVFWDFGDPNSGNNNYSTVFNPFHVFSTTGNFTVSLTVSYPMNQVLLKHDLEIVSLPEVNLGNDTTIFSKDKIVLDAGNPGANYTWSTGETTQLIYGDSNQAYWVLVEHDGCLSSDTIVIEEYPPCILALPSAFSPNADGTNDVLYVRGQNYQNFELLIFNRWGQLIFQTNNTSHGWDGTYKGEQQAVDTYNYHLNGKCIDGLPVSSKGTITLLK